MKTKLLSLTLMTMLFSSITIAQTKTWDFGNDRTTWPVSSGITTQRIVDNLGLYPISTNTNFGAITTNNASFTDGFTATHRFQMNGAGYSGSTFMAMPTQRFLFFDVSGACTVKVWFKTGSNGATRTVYVTNGSAAIGSAATNSGGNDDSAIVTASYTGSAGRLYIYGDTACNLYKVTVNGATVSTTTLGIGNHEAVSLVNVFSKGSQIFLTNVQSSTEVKVYNINGALVKSLATEGDTSFDLEAAAGVYIVNVKSVEGQKSVKLVVQ